MKHFFQQLLSPKYFYDLAGWSSTTLFLFSGIGLIVGLIGGLWYAPPDYQQGDGFRILYVHVPCAMLSLSLYIFMAILSICGIIWRIKMTLILTRSTAVVGAWFTFLALFTGSVWGKPMWGAFWVWDARLTSELILLFIYLGYIALQHAMQDSMAASRAGALFVIIGIIDIPIIHYSVNWWNTLHQASSLSFTQKPQIETHMLIPLLTMIFAFYCFAAALVMLRARTEILSWEFRSLWVHKLLGRKA